MEPWHIVYPLLSSLLADYYGKNKENAGRRLYLKLKRNREFKDRHFIIHLSDIGSVDPVHIFISFNRRKQEDIDRTTIINELFNILGGNRHYDQIDFNGCPAPFSLKISSARPIESQQQIWNVFSEAIKSQQRALNQDVFDLIKNWYGLEIVSFSIFLFWIRPRFFLPLDKNTMKLFAEAGITFSTPRNFKEYKRLLVQEDTDLYIETAKNAFEAQNTPTLKESFLTQIQKSFLEGITKATGNFIFRLVALQPCKGIAKRFHKNLTPDNIYPFYQQYEFKDDGRVGYDPDKEIGLFDLDNINISVSAVVGKNGSGKSTLTELFFLTLNNLSHLYLGKTANNKLVFEDEVNIDLYFHRVDLFRISLKGQRATIIEYALINKHFSIISEREMQREDFNEFFYSIAISYSQYSLNSLKLGPWIQELFHKNDGYQIPLVISPMRDEGNFNINKENKLLKSRLLALILEPEENGNKNELRKLTEEGYASQLYLKENKDKIDELKKASTIGSNWLIKPLFDYFKITDPKIKEPYLTIAKKYLITKLYKIGDTYEQYEDFINKKDGTVRQDKFDRYLYRLKKDNSHVTQKLKQAIYFLKYGTFNARDLDRKTDLNILANRLRRISEVASSSDGNIPLIHLIPPSFFEVDIYLEGDISLDSLSSGELQKIYSTSSIAYHLANIDSVDDSEKLIRYPYVNVLFDEVELYFHPDMQRTFIHYLIDYLSRLPLDKLYSVNICFITHSPFILSDIPADNILLLEKGNVESQDRLGFKTFGGNIHDLLMHQFFLERGTMGLYAQTQIDYATKALVPGIKTITEVNPKILEENWDREKVKKLISIIGDELVKSALSQLYKTSEYNNITDVEIEEQIKFLQDLQEKRKNNNRK